MPLAAPAIATDGLTKRYGDLTAVDGVTLTVEAGEIFGLLGPNGAGKSTFIKMLLALTRPTAGRAYVCGHDVAADPMAVRRCIGWVTQEVAVDRQLTARENLLLQAGIYHVPKDEMDSRINELLAMVELTDRADTLVKTYSGGMKKRLDLAMGLIHRPQVLFLDEPTLGLDIQTRRRLWAYIRHLRAEAGMTILLTTHYLDEADQLCDRVAIIDAGRIQAIGTPAELKEQAGRQIVRLELTEADRPAQAGFAERIGSLGPVLNVRASGAELHLSVTSHREAVPALLDAAEQAGVTLASINCLQPTLDDVFLALTGHRIREEEPV